MFQDIVTLALVTLSKYMWKHMCGGAPVHERCRSSSTLILLDFVADIFKTTDNKKVRAKRNKSMCKEVFRHLHLSKCTVQKTTLVKIFAFFLSMFTYYLLKISISLNKNEFITQCDFQYHQRFATLGI